MPMFLDHVGCLLKMFCFVFISFLSPFKFHWATPSVIGSQNEKPFLYLIIQFEPLFFLHHFLNVLISFLIIFFNNQINPTLRSLYPRSRYLWKSFYFFFLSEWIICCAGFSNMLLARLMNWEDACMALYFREQ